MKACLFVSDELSFLSSLKEDVSCAVANCSKKPKTSVPLLFIESKKHDSALEEEIISFLKSNGADLIVLANYKYLIKSGLIEKYRNRIISVHPSLLPLYPGKISEVYEGVLERGVKLTGCTLHFVDEGVDTGQIILQKPVEVKQEDNVETLHARMVTAEKEILKQGIGLLKENKVKILGRKTKVI